MNIQKMVYEPSGAVFWDEMAGYRRWNQITGRDEMYQVVTLSDCRPLKWFKVPVVSLAVVDDFGNLVRVQ